MQNLFKFSAQTNLYEVATKLQTYALLDFSNFFKVYELFLLHNSLPGKLSGAPKDDIPRIHKKLTEK